MFAGVLASAAHNTNRSQQSLFKKDKTATKHEDETAGTQPSHTQGAAVRGLGLCTASGATGSRGRGAEGTLLLIRDLAEDRLSVPHHRGLDQLLEMVPQEGRSACYRAGARSSHRYLFGFAWEKLTLEPPVRPMNNTK